MATIATKDPKGTTGKTEKTLKEKLADKKALKGKTGDKAPATTKVDKQKLDTKNIKDTIKQTVESQREVKYKYPAEVKDQLARKKWRMQTRNQDKNLLKAINTAELGKDKKAIATAKEEYNAFQTLNFLVPMLKK